jgi:hypothetical protein
MDVQIEKKVKFVMGPLSSLHLLCEKSRDIIFFYSTSTMEIRRTDIRFFQVSDSIKLKISKAGNLN